MRQRRFQFKYRANASNGHKAVGEILRHSPYFENYQSFQEWPVEKVNPKWTSGREHYDWVVPALKLVIEFHGEQHYKPVQFGGISVEEAQRKLKAQKQKDIEKEQAAAGAGWTYVAIPYDIDFDDEWLLAQYKNSMNPDKPVTRAKLYDWADRYKTAKESYNSSSRADEDRERALEYRKKKYQAMKAYKKSLKEKK